MPKIFVKRVATYRDFGASAGVASIWRAIGDPASTFFRIPSRSGLFRCDALLESQQRRVDQRAL